MNIRTISILVLIALVISVGVAEAQTIGTTTDASTTASSTTSGSASGTTSNSSNGTGNSSSNVIVIPQGTFYYNDTAFYHTASGTMIPAGVYYNPVNGAIISAETAAIIRGGTNNSGGSSTGGTSTGGTSNGTVTSGSNSPGAPNTGFGGGEMIFMAIALAMIAGSAVYIGKYSQDYR